MSKRYLGDEFPEDLYRTMYQRGAELGREHRERAVLNAVLGDADNSQPIDERLGNRKFATPQKIFELATKNVVVNHVLTLWSLGSITWEEAMTSAVVALAEQNERLTGLATAAAAAAPPRSR